MRPRFLTQCLRWQFGYNTMHLPAAVVGGEISGDGYTIGGSVSTMQNKHNPTWYHIQFLLSQYFSHRHRHI